MYRRSSDRHRCWSSGNAIRDDEGPRATVVVADDSSARTLHRRDGDRCRGHGKNVRVHVPYTDQLLRWKASDPERKIGGLILEVKGDFCQQVRGMLARAGRASDYTEIRLGGDICYNPLHNNLDPYAVAYTIATLVNNLFGKSKEPFWQQAHTALLKFVILLRRLADGYTTFAEVWARATGRSSLCVCSYLINDNDRIAY